MFIAVQFPLADVRSFVPFETNRLYSPTWPIPSPKEFVRSLGPIRRRAGGGADEWAGEELYCRASRAFHFDPPLATQRVGEFTGDKRLLCICRRFFSDGGPVGRLELGFRPRQPVEPLDRSELAALVESCYCITTKVPGDDGICELRALGDKLAGHYLKCTTRKEHKKELPTQEWWVAPGIPLIMLEASTKELPVLPRTSRQALKRNGLELSHCWFEKGGEFYRAWFLRTEDGLGSIKDETRRLRIHLFRLHAERECLKHVLRLIGHQLEVPPKSVTSDALQLYLRNAVRLLSQQNVYGFSQSEIMKQAQDLENLISPGERGTLLAKIGHVRMNIRRGIARITQPQPAKTEYVQIIHGTNILIGKAESIGGTTVTHHEIHFGSNTTFHGDFVVAETIQGSFNKLQEYSKNSDLKVALEELHKAVTEMSKNLPIDKAREAARDLDALTSEATSAAPRRKWYELSSQGLIDAATTLGNLGGPVLKCVKLITGLLGTAIAA